MRDAAPARAGIQERTGRPIRDLAAEPGTPPARRADAGVVHLTRRDIVGMISCGEMHGVPDDLLASLLAVRDDRLRAITRRWRRAGYARTARLGPGPAFRARPPRYSPVTSSA
jgi:hypothetical protein